MENDQLFDQMVQLLGELVTTAGPEWTMEFLQGGLEEAGAGMMPEGETVPQMPARGQAGPKNAFAQ